jgi:hypothetical protein
MTVRLRDEEGQALLLALGFLAFFGLLIPAVLDFATTSVLVTQRLRDQRLTIYAAGGAVDGAILYVRDNTNCGWSYSPDCTFNVTISGMPVTVVGHPAGQQAGTVIDADRSVLFTASIGGVQYVQAKVLFHDSATVPPAVDVLSWTVFP